MTSNKEEVKSLIAFLDNNFQRTILKLTRFDKDQISSSKPSDKVCNDSREEYSRLYRCLDNAIDRLHYHSGDNFDFYRTRASHTISQKRYLVWTNSQKPHIDMELGPGFHHAMNFRTVLSVPDFHTGYGNCLTVYVLLYTIAA